MSPRSWRADRRPSTVPGRPTLLCGVACRGFTSARSISQGSAPIQIRMRVPGANWSLASLRTYSCAASGHSEHWAVPSLPRGRRQSTANSRIARTRDRSDPCSARAPIRLLPVLPCIRHSTGADLPQTERLNTPSRPTKEFTPSLNTEGVMPSPFSSSARSASMSVGPVTQVLQRSAYRAPPIRRLIR